MKSRNFTIPFLSIFTFLLFLLSPTSGLVAQTHCCCSFCGPDCITNDFGDCPTSCAILSCNPAGAENSNDPVCADTPSCGVIPVELVYFKTKTTDRGIELNWQTESEINNEGFEIQRMSGVDIVWERIDFVAGNGTTTSPVEYNYLDRTPPPGINYYRLLQIDFDGKAAYSEIEASNLNKDEEYTVWPTLAKDFIILRSNHEIQNHIHGKHVIEIFDMMGQRVMVDEFDEAAKLDISELAKGNYVLSIYYERSRQTLRFVKVE